MNFVCSGMNRRRTAGCNDIFPGYNIDKATFVRAHHRNTNIQHNGMTHHERIMTDVANRTRFYRTSAAYSKDSYEKLILWLSCIVENNRWIL
jgi:hypothetical protein